MNSISKEDYFRAALRSGAAMKKEWILAIFSVIVDGKPKLNNVNYEEEEINGASYPYRIYQINDDPSGVYFFDPDNPSKLGKINNVNSLSPLFDADEYIELAPGTSANIIAPVKTRYYTAVINDCVFSYPFGDKVPYIQKRMSGWIDDEVAKLVDITENVTTRDPKKIYVEELLKYHESLSYIKGLTQICSPAVTARAIIPSKEVLALRDRLLEENKDKLNDPAVVVSIMKQIADADKEQLKDDPSAKFYIGSKSFNITRMKALYFYGLEYGFGDTGTGPTLITKSLEERLPLEDLPVQIDTIRNGSYARGIATAFGGAKVKYASRIFQNTRITEDDCGTKQGINWVIREDTKRLLENRFVLLDGGKTELITADFLNANIGKTIKVRTPQHCLTEAPYYCAKCLDKYMAIRPEGLYLAPMDVNSIFMNMSMKAMHGKQRSIERLDLSAAFNY